MFYVLKHRSIYLGVMLSFMCLVNPAHAELVEETAYGRWTIRYQNEERPRAHVEKHAHIYQEMAADRLAYDRDMELVGWSLKSIEIDTKPSNKYFKYRARAVVSVILATEESETDQKLDEEIKAEGASDVLGLTISLDTLFKQLQDVVKSLGGVKGIGQYLPGILAGADAYGYAERLSAMRQRIEKAQELIESGTAKSLGEFGSLADELYQDIEDINIDSSAAAVVSGVLPVETHNSLLRQKSQLLDGLRLASIRSNNALLNLASTQAKQAENSADNESESGFFAAISSATNSIKSIFGFDDQEEPESSKENSPEGTNTASTQNSSGGNAGSTNPIASAAVGGAIEATPTEPTLVAEETTDDAEKAQSAAKREETREALLKLETEFAINQRSEFQQLATAAEKTADKGYLYIYRQEDMQHDNYFTTDPKREAGTVEFMLRKCNAHRRHLGGGCLRAKWETGGWDDYIVVEEMSDLITLYNVYDQDGFINESLYRELEDRFPDNANGKEFRQRIHQKWRITKDDPPKRPSGAARMNVSLGDVISNWLSPPILDELKQEMREQGIAQ